METMNGLLNTTTKLRRLSHLGYAGRKQKWSLLAVLLFLGTALSAAATGFTSDFIVVSQGRGGSRTTSTNYYTNDAGGTGASAFQGQYLGSFDRNASNTDSLYINGIANTVATNGQSVQAVTLLYRVYRADEPVPSTDTNPFFAITLPQNGGNTAQNANWQSVRSRQNLPFLSSVVTPGTYTLELYFQGDVENSDGTKDLIFDSNQHYTASFSVTFSQSNYIASTWSPKSNSASADGTADWFDGGNWSLGVVPNSNTDVTIPYDEVSDNPAYPVIGESGQPSNTASYTAQAHNIIIGAQSDLNGVGARLFLGSRDVSRQNGAQLFVYGNFEDNSSGFEQTDPNSLLIFGGGAQAITAPFLRVISVRISGGSDKTLSGNMDVVGALYFQSSTTTDAGRLVTNATASLGVRLVSTVSGTATINSTVNGITSPGETERGYILGIVRNTSTVSHNNPNTFGNIGVQLTTTGDPGDVSVTRFNTYVRQGVGTSVSIRRFYTFAPTNAVTGNFDLVFGYLDAERNGIAAQNLRLFRTRTGGKPFEGLNGTPNPLGKTVTRTAITGTLAATFTLGDVTNPLPVTLVSFTAVAGAKGVALNWQTGSELNNKGFGVERQLPGGAWQQVGYVAGTNLPSGSTYKYLDQTLPTSVSQAYYRLRQEDIDGKQTYSAVAAISQAVDGSALTLSPVPLKDGPLSVNFAEAGQAGSEVLILNMQGQRVARFTTTGGGESALSLPLNNLSAGVYILQVQVPGQAARHARFVKE